MLYQLAFTSLMVFTSVISAEPNYCDLTAVECPSERPEYIEQYIRSEFNKNGLDGDLAVKVAQCESYLKPYLSYTNKDGTVDRGLWMLNSYFNSQVFDECAYYVECSTKVAIEIVKEWNGFGAWICYSHHLIK